jgi:cytochrome c553
MPLVRFIPIAFPAIALVAGLVLSARAFSELVSRKALFAVCALLGIAAGVLCAAVYRGGDTLYVEPRAEIASEALSAESRDAALLWKIRCAACHGEDGNRNYKFVREFFPLPTEFSAERLDSLGTDSLAKVILDGRNYMSPQRGRISDAEAHNLAVYMRFLAGGVK